MSQAAHESINVGDISNDEMDTGGNRYVRQSAQNQTSQGQSNFSDSSGPLFNMYVKMAEEEDNKLADRWQKDADGILIFTGLFSAAVAALAAVSIQDLRPNSQDTSAFYLENIYQLLADPNVSRASILAAPARPPPFSPPKYAIWVNSLWFLSLAISLTCALLATLLQQWARRYLTVTQPPRYSPHKRARIRAFFADGVEKFHLPWAVGALPTLLHLSLFLFFSGLLIFLVNINHTVFNVVVWWIGLTAGVYGCIALMPIFRQDSPYYTPLSSSVWLLCTGIPYTVFQILYFLSGRLVPLLGLNPLIYADGLRFAYCELLLGGIVKRAQETASTLSAEIDSRILKWTFDALDEDHELEQFFEGIPGFCSSNVVDDPQSILGELDDGLGGAFSRFLYRTWSSNLVSETVKNRRLIICAKAADIAHLSSAASMILVSVFNRGIDGVLRSAEIGNSLRSKGDGDDRETGLCAQGIVAGIIANVPARERDDQWIMLTMDQLGISEEVLQDYLTHGDSVLLANLIDVTRYFFRSYLDGDHGMALLNILGSISKFDSQNTLPGLQHDFCALWNEVVLEARTSGAYSPPGLALNEIHHIYLALHQGTDFAPTSSYDCDDILVQPSPHPLCNIPGHRPCTHQVVDSTTRETAVPPAPSSFTVPHPDTALTSITAPSPGPDVSPLPPVNPDHGCIHPADELSPHDVSQATRIIEFPCPAPPIDVESHHFPTTSSDSATAFATEGPVATSTISGLVSPESGPHSTPAASTSIPQPLFTLTSNKSVSPGRSTPADDVGS